VVMVVDNVKLSNGIEYISCPYLVFGDYGGAGSVGLGNIRALSERFKESIMEINMGYMRDDYPDNDGIDADLVIEEGSYSSKKAWLRLTDESRDLIDELDGYPLIEDDFMSEVESEWEEEAWSDYVKIALLRDYVETLDIKGYCEDDAKKDISDDQLWDCYRYACEATNIDPVPEYSSSYIDVGGLQAEFNIKANEILKEKIEMLRVREALKEEANDSVKSKDESFGL